MRSKNLKIYISLFVIFNTINSAPNKIEQVFYADFLTNENECYYQDNYLDVDQDYYYKIENPNLNWTIFIQYLSVNSFSLYNSKLDLIKSSNISHNTFDFQLDQKISEYYLKINVGPNSKYIFCISAFHEKANKIEYNKDENRSYGSYEIISPGKFSFYLQNITSNLYGFRILNNHLKNYKKSKMIFTGLYSNKSSYTLELNDYFISKNYIYFPLKFIPNNKINEAYLDIYLEYDRKKPNYDAGIDLLEIELVDNKKLDKNIKFSLEDEKDLNISKSLRRLGSKAKKKNWNRNRKAVYYEVIRCNKDQKRDETNHYYFGKTERKRYINWALLKELTTNVFNQVDRTLGRDVAQLKYHIGEADLIKRINASFPKTIKVTNDEYNLEVAFKTPFIGNYNISIFVLTDVEGLNYDNMCDLHRFFSNPKRIERNKLNNKLAVINRDVKVTEDLNVDILVDKTYIRHLVKRKNWEVIVIARLPKFPQFFIVYEPYFNDINKYLAFLDTREGNSKFMNYFYVIIFIGVAAISIYFLYKSYMKKNEMERW